VGSKLSYKVFIRKIKLKSACYLDCSREWDPKFNDSKKACTFFYSCFCVFVDVELTGLSSIANNYTSGLALYNNPVNKHARLNIPVNEAVSEKTYH
jgi:hypothetical protein